ncbi:MAG: hypothetical protein M3P24_09695 [Gemmatimonadota bacterium]|nr:hypothetical protein [Gemmatimonadota bacterium]
MHRTAPLFLAALLSATPAAAQQGWNFEFFGGTAYSAPSRLTIRQAGEAPIRLTARWSTRPLADAPYYAYRFARWRNGRGWEAELLHHKVYLENPPAEVEGFEVSHGYNLVTLGRGWSRGDLLLRLGAGAVLAFPETTVRGRKLSGGGNLPRGYHLSGPTAQAAVGRRFPLVGGLFAVAEGKLTASYARVPVAGGRAEVPNAALHGLLGVGYAFPAR